MSPPPTRTSRRRGPSKGELREAAILDHAQRLLAEERSVSSISIAELAEAAGISRSSFYFYFESKEAVLRALSDRITEDVRGSLEPFLSPDPFTPELIRRGVVGYLSRWEQRGAVLRAHSIAMATDERSAEFWTSVRAEQIGAIAANVEAKRGRGELPLGPPARELVELLFNMLYRAGFEHSLRPRDASRKQELVDAATFVITRTLGIEGS